MALTLPDCTVATLVDWTTEWTKDGVEKHRNPIRRGVIVKIVGENSNEGSVKEIWVKFRHDEDAILVQGRELSRYLPHTSKYAQEAYRRVMGVPKNVGAEFSPRAPIRRKVQDALAVSPRKQAGVVQPGMEDAAMDAMGFTDGEEPAAANTTNV